MNTVTGRKRELHEIADFYAAVEKFTSDAEVRSAILRAAGFARGDGVEVSKALEQRDSVV